MPLTARFSDIDWHALRADFPLLLQKSHNKPLAYLDNAATTQKPNSVIDAISHFYRADNANVHRGTYQLSERATQAYETTRDKIQHFLKAPLREEIIFVRGATEAINLVAQSYARPRLQKGDHVLISAMEHHSNIVPWQIVCKQTDAQLDVAPINDQGEIIIERYQQLLTEKTKIVALSHLSNVLGTINPVQQMTAMAHAKGIPVLLDGAQAAAHQSLDLPALDCDFYTFSGHKIYGPTGIGVLYGKQNHLDEMQPYQGGGDMIRRVSFEHTEYNCLPYKFEAGTPNIAGVVGLGAAIDYLQTIGMDNIARREQQLLNYSSKKFAQIAGLRIIGGAKDKASILSFILACAHPHDISTIVDQQGVAIRAGHHCAMPVMARFNVPATARVSFSFYNNEKDIEQLLQGLQMVQRIFANKKGAPHG